MVQTISESINQLSGLWHSVKQRIENNGVHCTEWVNIWWDFCFSFAYSQVWTGSHISYCGTQSAKLEKHCQKSRKKYISLMAYGENRSEKCNVEWKKKASCIMVCALVCHFWECIFLVESCIHTKQAWNMCTRLISERPSGVVLRGLGFKVHALICQRESMRVLLVYLNEQKMFTHYRRTLQQIH